MYTYITHTHTHIAKVDSVRDSLQLGDLPSLSLSPAFLPTWLQPTSTHPTPTAASTPPAPQDAEGKGPEAVPIAISLTPSMQSLSQTLAPFVPSAPAAVPAVNVLAMAEVGELMSHNSARDDRPRPLTPRTPPASGVSRLACPVSAFSVCAGADLYISHNV